MINSLLNALQPYLPELYFAAIVLGVIFFLWLLIHVGLSIRRNLRRKTWTRAPQTSALTGSFWQRIKNFLTKTKNFFQGFGNTWGESQNQEMGKSFTRTIEILKTYISAPHPQYELPWYMVIGPEGAGKTQILKDLNLERPVGQPDYPGSSERAKIQWSFYNQAVVLDLKGELILNKDQIASDEDSFETVLKLMKNVRVKRPLDGLILVLSADELGDIKRFSQGDIAGRAEYFYTQLCRLQNRLGMKVPVYVLISKCDLIPGFQEMVSELSPEQYKDILGWSSPYTLDVSYSLAWSREIFSHMHKILNRLRARILTKGPSNTGRSQEGNLIFPLEFSRLKEGLALYLTSLFKESSYHDTFFLRGVYFCGRSVEESAPSLDSVKMLTAFPESLSPSNDKPTGRVIFLQDLFERKIFKESSLGQPIRRRLLAATQKLNRAKAIAATLAFLWGVGIWHAYTSLQEDVETILPALKQIDTSLTGLSKFPVNENDPKRQNYLLEQSNKILKSFTGVKLVELKSFFLPLSWFTRLEEKILESVARGYNDVVFPTLYQTLLKRIAETVTYTRDATPQNSVQNVLNPILRPSFQALHQYVEQIIQLETFIDIYARLNETQNLTSFGSLIHYLYGHSLPPQFFKNSDYYKKALVHAVAQPVDLNVYKQAAAEKLGILYRNFMNDAFNQQDTLALFDSLMQKLSQLGDHSLLRHITDHEVREIGDQTVVVADALSSGQLAWIERDIFDPGPAFSTLLNNLLQSSLFGNEVVEELSGLADTEFIKYKLALQKYVSPLTGPFFDMRQGQAIAAPSKSMVEFIDTLTAFLTEPFMRRQDPHTLKTKIPPHKLLFWDENVLAKAVKMVESYEDFVAKKLKTQPVGLQTMMRSVALNTIQSKIVNYVAEAQNFQDEPLEDSFGQRELIHNQVQNISLVTPYFIKLLGALQNQYTGVQNAHMRELLVRENYNILVKIEKMLEHDNLYVTREDAFFGWDGKPMVGLKAFGVHDLNDMKSYLRAQRMRLQFLAKDLAEPILMLLSLGYLEDVPMDLPLASRWTRIITVLEDYDRQSPSNPLKILEHFLTYDINEITLENCAQLRDRIEDSIGGDYFFEVRGQVAHNLLKRCKAVTKFQFSDRYNEAAQFFNLHLAGRFPFTLDTTQELSIEADPQDVAQFLQLFDSIPQLEKLVTLVGKNRSEQEALSFVQDIQNLRPLMVAALEPGPDGALMPLDFEVTFRSDRSWERGGDKIIDWGFKVGGQEIKFWQDRLQGTWQIGDPIHVNFKWAQDAENLPITDPRKPALSVVEGTATYSYTGRWSLLRLLKAHGIYPKPQIGKEAPQAQRLEFTIPTAFNPHRYRGRELLPAERRSEEAQVYLRLALKEATKQEKAVTGEGTSVKKSRKSALLKISRFPVEAPLLDDRMQPLNRGIDR